MTDANDLINIEELSGSLTGYDEIAITRSFDDDLAGLRGKGTLGLRALVFVVRRREGMKDREARDAALKMPQAALMDLFDLDSIEGAAEILAGEDTDPKDD